MKLQHLAIIFVIIILPIALVVGEYIQMQIDTITLQKAYSSKLQTATYDSMKAFTLNTINNKYSTVSNSKIRDIEASISIFYTSLGNEINALANTPDNELRQYTPAILYNMYDGYYIYSKYYNDADSEYQYGLKPYIYYTCRYVDTTKKIDIIVNYTLDNYVTIYGNIGENYITKSGNIINPNMVTDIKWNGSGDLVSLKYGPSGNTIEIKREILTENISYLDNYGNIKTETYSYRMHNGNKVYYDGTTYFTLNKSRQQNVVGKEEIAELEKYTDGNYIYSDSALKYYYEAYLFSKWTKQYLGTITQDNAVDESGDQITDFSVDTGKEPIFDYSGELDVTGSCFDLNRISVIRRSIQTNLMTAIANYNRVSTNTYNYVLPVFSEEDWDNITNNISIVSFLQGIPIGAKYFNDYCVMTNNVNKEFVSLNSLYAITDNGEVHLLSCKDILDKGLKVNKVYKNIDFERQSLVISEGNETYYYPHYETRCYGCLVNVAELYDIDYVSGIVKKYDTKTNQYIEKNDVNSSALHYLRSEVLHAYGRESFDLYKVNDYFRGYDESISTDSITQEKTDNLEIHVQWDKNRHQAQVFVYKVAGVQESLRIQYLRYATNLNISDNDEWKTVNEGVLPEYFNLHETVYLRLYDGTYDGDYVIVIIRDRERPGVPKIEVTGDYNEETGYYLSQNIHVKITAGKDDQSGFKSLVYTVKQNGNEIKNIETSDEVVEFEIPEDGMITIEAQTKDKAENLSEKAFYGLNKDSLPPNVPTIEVIGDSKDEFYYDEVEVKFIHGKDREPNPSGIKALYYTVEELDNPASTPIYGQAYDGEIIKVPSTMEGTVKISAYMEDKAGNKSDVVTKKISKDNIKPKIVTTISASDITTSSFRLNITVQDEHSGIEKIIWYYKHNDLDDVYKSAVTDCEGERTQITKNILIDKLISGIYTAYAEVYDKAGNKEKTGEISITTDTIKEPTSASASPTGWTNGNVTVTLPQEGYTTEYQSGGIDGAWTSYTGPFEVPSNTTVYYRYSDGTNKGVYKTIAINNIDKKLPEIKEELKSTVVTSKGFSLSIKVKDENSGYGKVIWKYKLDGETTYIPKEEVDTPLNGADPGKRGETTVTIDIDNLTNGKYKVYAEIYDVAGNVKKSEEINVTLAVIDTPSGATISPEGWTNGNVTVTLPTKQGYTTKYQVGSTTGAWINYTEKLTITSNTTVYYLYNDGTNSGTHSSIKIDKIETEAPKIKTQLSSSNITKTGFDLSVTVQDETSGLGKIVWKLDGDAIYEPKETVYTTLNGETAGTTSEVTKTQTITVSKAETYNVYAEIYDVAGNKVQTQTITVKMHEHTEDCKHYHTGDEKTGTGCYSGGAKTQKKCGDTYEQKGYCSWWWDNANNRCIRCHGTDKNKEHNDTICKTCGANTMGNQVHNIEVYSLNCKYKDKPSGTYVCGYE